MPSGALTKRKELILLTDDSAEGLSKDVGDIVVAYGVSHRCVYAGSNDPVLVSGAGSLVLSLGSTGHRFLTGLGVVPKNRTITSLRTKLFTLPNALNCMLTYSTGVVNADYEKYIDLLTDVGLACRFVKTGTLEPQVGTYTYVEDFEDDINWIKARYHGIPVEISIDTETLGLDYHSPTGYIVSIQLTVREGHSSVVYFKDRKSSKNFNGNKKLKSQLKWLMTSHMVSIRGANFKYDRNWLSVFWGLTECTSFKFDTLLVGSLIDENRSNSLNVHGKIYTTMGGYDDSFNHKYDKSRMDLVPKEELLTYAGGDTDCCYQVSLVEKAELTKDKKLTTFYREILHPAAVAYERVEQTGWCIDQDYYQFLKYELEAELDELVTEAKSILGGRIIAKHTNAHGELNIKKASLLVDYMFSTMGLGLKPLMKTEKTKEPSSSLEHMMMFAGDPKAAPFVDILTRYASATKTYSTYVVGFMECIRSDGRFHPTYFLFSGDDWGKDGGAVTGRISVKDPAIQTIPKHTTWAKRLRKAFIAPPGYLVLSNDYSQGELKIAACLANEENMIGVYRKGIDLHAVTAAGLSGLDLAEFMKLKEIDEDKFEEIRFLGKAGNFGLLYGMSAEGFQAYAEATYHVVMSLEQAFERHSGFFKLYPRLIPWHNRQKAMARKFQLVRSPLGRVRHLPLVKSYFQEVRAKAERQAINSPVQGTLSDMALWATAILEKRGLTKKAPVFGMVHDQLLSYVPEANYEYHIKARKEIMENLPFDRVGWKPQLQFTVDSQIGPNMGALKKAA